jgi:hypothetical protein
VRITNREKLNLERFGCTLRESTGVFLIDWKGRRSLQAATAEIFAALSCIRTKTGAIVLLAFEVSPIRPLPQYFYFPFDLDRKSHRNCLSRLSNTGEVRLSFVDGKRSHYRKHALTAYLRLRVEEICADALREYQSPEGSNYDFEEALKVVERHVRIPQLVHREFLDDTLREMSGIIEEAIKTVPSENKDFANGIVRMAAEAFEPYYQNNRKAFLDNLHAMRFGLTCISDIHRMFFNNSEGLRKFISDALAILPRQQLNALAELVASLVAVSKLPFKAASETKEPVSTALAPIIPELPAGLSALLQSMAASGISKDTTKNFFDLLGLEVGGKPGRPTKDYSREYELRASGLKWSEIAARALQENAGIKEEFGGQAFQSLSFQERENLKNRIREGVRTFAERTGKTSPIGPEDVPDQGSPAEK